MIKLQPTPLEQSLFLFCQAMTDENKARAGELRRHLLTEFELDSKLREVLSY